MKTMFYKTFVMVVFILLAVAAPPVRADDDKPPPCKPEQHDCRCDPGNSRQCRPCTSDHDGCCDPDAVGAYGIQSDNDDDDCKPPCKTDDDDDPKCTPSNPKVWICYQGDVIIDRGNVFLNHSWIKMQIKRSDIPQYQGRKAFRVLASGRVVCPFVIYQPFTRNNHDGSMAGGNPK